MLSQVVNNNQRALRIDPNKSAYADLGGEFDFNRYRIALTDTNAVIYKPADSRTIWVPRATDAWYIGPAKEHYHVAMFFVTETSAYRISASAKMFPQYCSSLPDESSLEHAEFIVNEL